LSKKRRQASYLDGNDEILQSDVIRFAVGDAEDEIRSEVWTIFGSATKPDFYVTSSLISTDQKGSIHASRAQFGYTSQTWPPSDYNWVGEPPKSRHLEILNIPELTDGEHFHVLTVRLPGIGLRHRGRAARRPRPLVLFPSYGLDTCVTLNLVLYQGDWRDFISPLPGQKAVAAVRNDNGRSLIVFLRREYEADPRGRYRELLRSLPSASARLSHQQDMTVFVTHSRAPNKPIVLTELHNISTVDND
jgi:hypothetical protein